LELLKLASQPEEIHERMAEVLGVIRGRFILSLNAVRGVFETFSKFQIEEVDCVYSVGGNGHSKSVKEVIISGQ
jgi:DNA adenine methylase